MTIAYWSLIKNIIIDELALFENKHYRIFINSIVFL